MELFHCQMNGVVDHVCGRNVLLAGQPVVCRQASVDLDQPRKQSM